jgi:uncharacterized membrane protein
MLDPAIAYLLATAFALLLTAAALHKLRDLRRFAAAFSAYRILPQAGTPLARLIPVLELSFAAGLLMPRSRAAAATGGALLLCVYAAAIALNLARGRREVSCGCGGPNDRRPIAGWMIARNLLLAAALAALLLPVSPRPLAAADIITVGAGTAVAALLYMSLDQLLGRVAPRVALLRGAP